MTAPRQTIGIMGNYGELWGMMGNYEESWGSWGNYGELRWNYGKFGGIMGNYGELWWLVCSGVPHETTSHLMIPHVLVLIVYPCLPSCRNHSQTMPTVSSPLGPVRSHLVSIVARAFKVLRAQTQSPDSYRHTSVSISYFSFNEWSQYKEAQHGPCRRMTHGNRENTTFFLVVAPTQRLHVG